VYKRSAGRKDNILISRVQNLPRVQFLAFLFTNSTRYECVSIDIAEKILIPLEGHNQEKKEQHRHVELGHQHTPYTTQLKQLKLVGLGRRR